MNAFEKEIRERFSSKVEERGCFLVDVEVSADNDVTIVIEAMDRNVDLEDCVSLDKSFHEMWDQDAADYSLTVTSAGLDLPFKDLRQYLKAKGEKVEVRFRGGQHDCGAAGCRRGRHIPEVQRNGSATGKEEESCGGSRGQVPFQRNQQRQAARFIRQMKKTI